VVPLHRELKVGTLAGLFRQGGVDADEFIRVWRGKRDHWSGLLAASAFWFTLVKWVGGLYLLYLGVKLLRAGIAANDPAAPAVSASRWRLFANTYLVTALNPKGIVFFVAFLPQFTNPGASVARQLWVLAATFVVMATINATLYAVFADSARKLLSSSRAQRRFNLAGGSLLSAAGVWALLARRLP
jgi:threonine/homoserine/homoserine lactone efflux protein